MTDRRLWAAALGLFLLTVAVFAPAGRFAFLPYDDDVYVTGNPLVRGGLSWRAAAGAFTTLDSATANWIPATWLSHMADVSLFGARPGPHHLVNVGLHAAAAGLLALVLHALTGSAGPSLLVAALFAVHPLRVESVAWIAERKDVLSAFFWVTAMGAWLRYARCPRPGRYLAAAAAVLLALLAKPMAVTLPLALLLLDVWPLGRWRSGADARRLLLEKAPLLALSAGAGLMAWEAQQRAASLQLMDTRHLPLRLANALLSYVRYLGATAWPAGLSPFYTYHGVALVSWPVAAAALALAAIGFVAFLTRRSRPWIAVGWTWYLVALLPVIGIVQVGGQPMADRYTYLPSIGLLVACCWTAAVALRRRDTSGRLKLAAVAAATAVCVALAVASRVQLAHWKDGEAFFSRALRIAPDHFVLRALAEYNLGVAAAREGRAAEAERRFVAAVRARPAYAEAWNNLGGVRVLAGRLEEGERDLREALRLAPEDPRVHANLGLALGGLGRTVEAEAEFARAIALDPANAATRFQYGDFLQRLGRYEAASESYLAAVRLDPGHGEAWARLEELQGGAAPAGRTWYKSTMPRGARRRTPNEVDGD